MNRREQLGYVIPNNRSIILIVPNRLQSRNRRPVSKCKTHNLFFYWENKPDIESLVEYVPKNSKNVKCRRVKKKNQKE